MTPIQWFLIYWFTLGFTTMILELTRWGSFYEKLSKAEKSYPELRVIGPALLILLIVTLIICFMWPIRVVRLIQRAGQK